ncbi:MAG: hypothetical protein RL642_1569 [Bacteroidota bacterium]|jgi:hypothetical protein
MIVLLLSASNHPFYVSVTEIEYIPKSKEIGIAIKTFPDDLEETLRIFSGKKLDLYNKDKTINNQLIGQYLNKHLQIAVNKTQKSLNFLGYEIDKEAVWMYVNIPKINSVKELTIFNDVMYEYKPEQTNIVHINVAGNTTSYRLTAPNKEIQFKN